MTGAADVMEGEARLETGAVGLGRGPGRHQAGQSDGGGKKLGLLAGPWQ